MLVICTVHELIKLTKVTISLVALYLWSFINSQTSGISRDSKWLRVTTNESEWYNKWQWGTTNVNECTTNDHEWQRVVQRVTKCGTASEKEWQRVTKNDDEWRLMTASVKTNEYEWE